jgi:hypothetical protein
VDFETVIEREVRGCLAARRRALGSRTSIPPLELPAESSALDPKTVFGLGFAGLALSGGGIRSATFNLGLLQSLGRRGVLPRFDYLSTVSGGGYIGSCLSSLLSDPGAGVEPGNFPLRYGGSEERTEVKYLRQHSNYLSPRHGPFNLDTWRLVSAYILGLVVSLATGLALFCAASAAWILLYPRLLAWLGAPGVEHDVWGRPSAHLVPLFVPAAVALGLWLLVGLVYAGFSLFKWTFGFRREATQLLGLLLLLFAVLALVGALPLAFAWLKASGGAFAGQVLHAIAPNMNAETAKDAFLSLLASGASAAALFLVRPRTLGERAAGTEGLRPKLLGLAATALMLFTLVVVLFAVWDHREHAWLLLGMALALLAVLSFATDINRVSMFYFYRDRLSDAYIIIRSRDDVRPNDALKLSDVNSWERGGPYHLINTTVNLSGSRHPSLRGRKSDFFLLSPLYCGSQVTGYLPTAEYEGDRMGLASAMAISGAAANPQYGFRTSPTLAFLMALLNVRLGVWGQNPRTRFVRSGLARRLLRLWPYYLALELLAQSNEERWFLNLSDGGHIENLGVYELLRRRCRFILASDAGADPHCTFEDLGNLIRKARIDLGVQIKLDPSALVPDASGLSKDHVVRGQILYPEGEGTLLYVKTAVLASDSEDLRQYNREHAAFPHETTADQFFDEAQFESYRELGYLSGLAAADLAGMLEAW